MAKELPIGFTAEMIQAKREGRKNVTRRVIIPQPEYRPKPPIGWQAAGWAWDGKKAKLSSWDDIEKFKNEIIQYAPYQVGDLLWVKEGWRCTGGGTERNIIYKADGDTPMSFCGVDDARKSILRVAEPYWAEWDRLVYETDKGCNWRSPRFMPKWVARTWLEVVSVRAERLQDITEEDAIKEGALFTTDPSGKVDWTEGYVIACFCKLWDSINLKRGYSWESNPWVWRYEFKEYPVIVNSQ